MSGSNFTHKIRKMGLQIEKMRQELAGGAGMDSLAASLDGLAAASWI